MALTAVLTIGHRFPLSGEPASTLTLSNVQNGAGAPIAAVARKPKDTAFSCWLTVSNSGASNINVTSVAPYAIPHGATGASAVAAAVRLDMPAIGPGQTVAVPAGGSLALLPFLGSVLTPIGGFSPDGETDGSPASWANNTAYAVNDYVINPTFGKTFFCVSAGTSAASPDLGPQGTGLFIVDGTAVWCPGKQQQFDIGATVTGSDGSVVNATVATITILNAVPE